MIELKPPSKLIVPEGNVSVFLGGSIEEGKAIDWQTNLINQFEDEDNITFFNPRRSDWDSSWEQDISNDNFRWQVQWELDAMEMADVIVMYLQPGTLSPISMLEFGLHAKTNKLIVCSPEGFWRNGNIDIVSHKYYIKQVPTLVDLEKYIKYLI